MDKARLLHSIFEKTIKPEESLCEDSFECKKVRNRIKDLEKENDELLKLVKAMNDKILKAKESLR
ncbi:MAG: hypothetical protein GY800_08950 [Planctomycetes bacterium]|nr:hypothetical protein [Planctomycetota bacterium]